MINVNWHNAKARAGWLSRKTGKTYRLLSEAEREYVTRGHNDTVLVGVIDHPQAQANYDGSAEPYRGGGSKGEYRAGGL
jgi:formylglycine-generating enzyme required for sulfatase activity